MRQHPDNGHIYAATLSNGTSQKTGKSYRKYTHWGKLADNKVFVPNLEFVMLPLERRRQFIFPEDWDISAVTSSLDQIEGKKEESLAAQQRTSSSTSDAFSEKNESALLCIPDVDCQINNRLYGSVWFLLQIAAKLGVVNDLNEVFEYNEEAVNNILTLAIFPYLTQKNFDRCAKWQEYTKTPSLNSLTPSFITSFTQHIKDRHRIEFIKLRIERQPKDSYVSCDTTTHLAWGDYLAESHWWNNQDNNELKDTIEAVVYSLTTHEPVYYRTFPGNVLDLRTIRTIKTDLLDVDIKNTTFIFDKDYESFDNFSELFNNKIPFIMCSQIQQEPVCKFIEQINYDADGMPANMVFDEESKLYCKKFKIENQYFVDASGESRIVDDFYCNIYLNMVERVLEIQKLKTVIKEEKSLINNVLSKGGKEAVGELNKNLKYHKILLKKGSECKKVINCSDVEIIEKINTIKKNKTLAGFFSSVIYNNDCTAVESLKIYKARDEQERYFEQMKSQMDFHTQEGSSEDGKIGRLFILFIGLLLSSAVRSTWKNSIKLRKLYRSSYDLIDEMTPIRFCEYPDGSTHVTSFLSSQVEICKEFGIKVPDNCLSAPDLKHENGKSMTQKSGHSRNEFLGRDCRSMEILC
ncbi:MAG: transposase [Desulfovibrio sp.]|nr:transposase [Desulfovibrio sp.]